MINDPTTFLALALCVGILGLAVLILPLILLFWSQMEPQLAGIVGNGETHKADDEYGSQTVLPRLMKSFGHMAELEKEVAAKKLSRKKSTKAKSRKTTTTSTSRSQASATSKTVKAAPAKTKKKAASKTSTAKTAKAKAKTTAEASSKKKTTAVAKKKTTAVAKKAVAKKVTAKTAKSTSSKAATKRTPAGAKRDSVLGVVYSKKPKEIDDLKEIKGVAKVIEAKLHKAGVYTFRQIVEWDSVAIDAFSDKLSFKGRIRNEGWQKQCAKLHKGKYDEKI